MTDIEAQEGVPYNETCTVTIAGVTAMTTGYTAVWKIAYRGTSVLTLTEGSGVTTTAGAGVVSIAMALTAAQTAALDRAGYSYQLDLLLNGVVVLRPLQGSLLLDQDVVAG